MQEAIQIKNISKTYAGGQAALHNFSLSVKEGEVFGFLGPNGAGKTTAIRILLGLLDATSGSVEIFGGDPRKPQTRHDMGYLPETAEYYEFMNTVELLRFYGALCEMDSKTLDYRIDELLEMVDLTQYSKRPLRMFSKGMMQRAGIAQALLHDPRVLILDEPMTGLDPLGRLHLRKIIQNLREQGKTVFFSSHEMSETEVVCDRFGILKDGKLCWCGDPRKIVGDGEGNLERIFLDFIENKRDFAVKDDKGTEVG